MAHLLLMMIIDAGLLLFATWYIDAIYPGGEGVPQKLWFFLMVFRCTCHVYTLAQL